MYYIVKWLGSCHLPLFLLGSGLHLRDAGISSSQINFCTLMDEVFTRDSAGSGF